jgi:hypothetical protein
MPLVNITFQKIRSFYLMEIHYFITISKQHFKNKF